MRRVTERERMFLERYFGQSLDTGRIALGSSLGTRSWSPYGSRISLTRDLFGASDPRCEVRLESPRAASIFAHEALHVWQRQHGRRVTWEGAWLQAGYTLRLFDPYAYDRRQCDPASLLTLFVLGSIEQQGSMFQDYVYADCSGHSTTRFCRIRDWVHNAAADSLYCE